MTKFQPFFPILVFALLAACSTPAAEEYLPLVPYPVLVETQSCRVDLPNGAAFHAALDDTTGLSVMSAHLGEIGLSEASEGGAAFLRLATASADPSLSADVAGPLDTLGTEGYRLEIRDGSAIIAANTSAGVFYGVQTLRQLARIVPGSLPCVTIADKPSLGFRGLMDDISRGPIPTMDYFRQQIDRVSEMKYNKLTYYTEHIVKTRSHPAFAPADGVTIDEWAELTQYAKARHVELIPNFQSFGHFEHILSTPEYRHLGEGKSLLSPAYEESYQLLEDVFYELIPAMDAKTFNVNGDETFDLGKGASRAMVDSLGHGVVYVNHMRRIHEILQPSGVMMMQWADIMLNHPETLELLPKDIVMMTWNYDDQDDFNHMIKPLTEAGFRFTVSPGILNSYSTMPDFRRAKGNIRKFVRDGKANGTMGMLLTVWDDGGSALFSRDWYGVAFGAEQAWNPVEPDGAHFDDRFSKAVYGDSTDAFPAALLTLNKLADLGPTDRMNEKIWLTGLVPQPGEAGRYSNEGWDDVRQVLAEAETMLDQSAPERYADDLYSVRLTVEQYKVVADVRAKLHSISSQYKSAFNSTGDRQQALDSLLAAKTTVAELAGKLRALKEHHREAWLMENRNYALDRVMKIYDAHLADYARLETSVDQAITNAQAGAALAEPVAAGIDISVSSDFYFKEWLVTNPIPLHGEDPFTTDYLASMGGEVGTKPGVAQEFGWEGAMYRWSRLASANFDRVDYGADYAGDEPAVVYAVASIDSEEPLQTRGLLTVPEGAVVWLNGEEVARTEEGGNQLDAIAFDLHLVDGRSMLVVKLPFTSGIRNFAFRLDHCDTRGYKNRYRVYPCTPETDS